MATGSEVPTSPGSNTRWYTDLALAEVVRLRSTRRGLAARRAQPYESRFANWDERASVRRKPRRELVPQDAGALYFPPELVPVVSHPLVAEKGPEAVQTILIHRLYDYLHFTTELEELAVIPVAGGICRGVSGLDLPERMRADAFKIVTDEAWHAQFSYDLIRQTEQLTGVRHQSQGLPRFVGHLDVVRERLSPGTRGAEALLFAVVSETLISRILSDIPHDARLPAAVRDLVQDHAEDEGRHHAYFRCVLEYLWPALNPSERREVGPRIPSIIRAFLEPDFPAVHRSLRAVGLTPAQATRAVAESWPESRVQADIAACAQAAVRHFQQVGAMNDAETLEAFAEAGLFTANPV